ncbi:MULTISPECIES: hypothetical protein [Luteibacter]|uniref:hypothetical protein n=1 Tax=Luteibacter TaxID=242605 RepID=UPI000566210C|nr:MULTISPECIES: hypothetical protein [unclassified Luteibacter]
MSATYNNQIFRTRLEARWAAFFDLAGWKWSLTPAPVGNWAPEFRVEFPCGHSECAPSHVLLVAVLPVDDSEAFAAHPSQKHVYGINTEGLDEKPSLDLHSDVDAGAGFGSFPEATVWQFAHGAGGGIFSVAEWVDDPMRLWKKTEDLVS